MERWRVRLGVPVLLLGLVSVGCNGGSGTDTRSEETTTTVDAGGASGAAATSGTMPAGSAWRTTGVWLGGDPVQAVRDSCLAAVGDRVGATDPCADFPAAATWRTQLVECLRTNGLELRLDDHEIVIPLVRIDAVATTKAWAACTSVYLAGSQVPQQASAQALFTPDCMAAKGWIAVLSEGAGSPTAGDASALEDYVRDREACRPPDQRQHVVLCLRAQGAAVADIPTGSSGGSNRTASTIRGDPAVTSKAWAACRSTFITAVGMATEQADSFLATPDCMAGKGWLIAVMTGPPSDLQAYNADMQACQTQTPSNRLRAEFFSCLKANGIDAVDPSTVARGATGPSGASGAAAVTPRYAPELAAEAWAACRSSYISAVGMPAGRADEYLATPDCMAAKGWLIVAMSGPPADMQAYSAAMAECSPASNPAPPTTRPGPQRYPTLAEWVACFRAQGVAVADPSGGAPVTGNQVFPAAAVSAAFTACVGSYGGVLDNAPGEVMVCVAKAGVVPGLAGPGTASAMDRCGVTAVYLTGRDGTDAQNAFSRCLVDNGVVLHPLLRTIDTVLGPWSRCTTGGAVAPSGFAVANPDGTEADLATLRYWDCLAANGLVYPDARRSSPAPDLERARRAIAACRDLAVRVVRREQVSGD